MDGTYRTYRTNKDGTNMAYGSKSHSVAAPATRPYADTPIRPHAYLPCPKNQSTSPSTGFTRSDGRPLFPARTRSITGCLVLSLMTKATQRAALMRGNVNVSRWVSNFGTKFATTFFWVSSRAAVS